MDKIRKLENFHIVLWLFKDISWLMEWRVFGIFMIVPTLGFAGFITWKFREFRVELIHNIVVMLWITANSFWMITEFFKIDEYKIFASIPFFIGLSLIAYYYGSLLVKAYKNK